MITVVVSINDRRGGGGGARRKQFDPAALMQVLMIADISRGLEAEVFEIISSHPEEGSFLLFIKSAGR